MFRKRLAFLGRLRIAHFLVIEIYKTEADAVLYFAVA
jgi:hypothetical protein